MNNNECLTVRIRVNDGSDNREGKSSDEGNSLPHPTASLTPPPIPNNLFLIPINY